ncbi:MAG: hypothetical protein HY909_14775 [Deltaproteobacteria bacterium]|nr:hypothetical protein [Deltaproteobacteria bacterium]
MRRRSLTLALALALGLLRPAAGQAQVDPATLAATRRDLIRQAQDARAAGDHARALDLASRAGQLGMSPSLRRFIAEEQQATGLLAEALGSAEQCVREAERDTASRTRDEHVAACRALVTALGPRVGRVVVQVPEPPEGLTVRVGAVQLPRAVWGVAHMVTPGAVVVEATAPGRRPFRQEVRVTEGAQETMTVRLEPEPSGTPAQGPVVLAPPPGDGRERAPVEAPPRRSWAGPVAVLGVGVLSLGASGVLLVLRNGALASRDRQCDGTGCPEEARADHDRAASYNALTNVTLAVGAGGLALGALWLLVSRPWETPRPVTLTVAPGRDGVWVGVGGTL